MAFGLSAGNSARALLSAAMSLWLSGCLFIALLNRGPRGYAFLLAGYTTAFIGFPAVTSPETIFDTVVARSEEIIPSAYDPVRTFVRATRAGRTVTAVTPPFRRRPTPAAPG